MNKSIATSMTTVALLAGMVAPAFAETAAVSGTASSTPNTATKIACVGTAVNAREKTIGTAEAAFMAAINTAYATRASALQQAYTLTTAKDTRAAAKTAWAAFSKSVKTARTDWRSARDAAWTTFRTASKNCKAPEGVSDVGNSGSEVSIN